MSSNGREILRAAPTRAGVRPRRRTPPVSFTTRCPECGARYMDVPATAAGLKITCRRCGASFAVALEETATPPVASPPATLVEPEKHSAAPAPAVGTEPAHAVPPTVVDVPPTRIADAPAPAAATPPSAVVPPTELEPPGPPPPAASAPAHRKRTAPEAEGGRWKTGELILGLYEVVDMVGEGGMGRVYRVHHRGWGVDLAVKSPLPSLLASPGGTQSFVHEAETWVNLGLHPNIVSCFYVRTVSGVPHVFAEYVGGGSMHQWVKHRHFRNAAEVVDIGIQLAWGLAYAHQQGLVHQDVKPANIMLTSNGEAKITDFGLARAGAVVHGPAIVVDGGTQSVMVSSGGMTPAYCSPEQQEGGSLTRRTDIWSWGVSLLEAFVGEVSWRSGVVAPQVMHDLQRAGGSPGAPELPASLAEILRQCWQTDPQQRPATMDEVADELVHIYRELTGESYPRQRPRAGRDTADSLNNRAISLLDLGREDEAEQLWRQAQGRQAHHVEATYNWCIHAWRHGAMNDREVVQRMQELERSHTGGARGIQLLGKIHLALADYSRAVERLDLALQTMPDNHELQRDHALALWGLAASHNAPERWRAAQAALAEEVRTTRPDARLAVAYAASLCDTGREDEALDYYRSAQSEIVELPAALAEALDSYRPSSDVLHHWRPFTRAAHATALSRDASTAAAAGDSHHIVVWDTASGTVQCSVKLGERNVVAIALNGAGELLLVAVEQEAVSVLDSASGRRYRGLQPHQGRLNHLVVSATGTHVAGGSSDRRVRLWTLADGILVHQMEGHTGAVTAVALDHPAEHVVSGSIDGTVRLWECQGGTCLQVLAGHRGRVNAVAVSGDGRCAVSGGDDGEVRLWDLERGSLIRCLRGHSDAVSSVAFCGGGSAVVSASADGSVRRWELGSGLPEVALRFSSEVLALSLAGDDRIALASCNDGVLLVRPFSRRAYHLPYALSIPVPSSEASDRTQRFENLLTEARSLIEARRYPDAVDRLRRARTVEGFERDPDAIDLWQRVAQRFPRGDLMGAWERQSSEQLGAQVTAVAADPTSPRAAIGLANGQVAVLDLVTGVLHGPWPRHDNMVSALAFSHDGEHLYSASWDREIHRSPPLGEVNTVFKGHSDYVLDLSPSPDRQHLLSVGSDGTLRWWHAESSEVSEILATRDASIAACVVSPDGRVAMTADWDGALVLYDLRKRTELGSFGEGKHPTNAVDISPDGALAVTAGVDRSIRLWDLRSGRCLRVLTGHTDQVTAVCFSPDGRFAASASNDGTARLWDLRESRAIRTFEGHNQTVASVAFDATGTTLISGGYDGSVRVWHLDWDPQLDRGTADWDDHARPYLEIFLYRRLELDPLPATGDHVRLGREDLRALHRELMKRGFGWLPPDAVRHHLQEMANDWTGSTSVWRAIRDGARSRRKAASAGRRRRIPVRMAVTGGGIALAATLAAALGALAMHVTIDPATAEVERNQALRAMSPSYIAGLSERCRQTDLDLNLEWSLNPLESSELSVSCLCALADERAVVAVADRLRELERLVATTPTATVSIATESFLRSADGSPLLGSGVPAARELVRVRRLCFTVFQTLADEHLDILDHYLRDPSPEVQTACAGALAARDGAHSAKILLAAFDQGDDALRLVVARVLPRMVAFHSLSGHRLWSAVRRACSDESPAVRAAAVPALALFADRRAERLARELCADPDAATAAVARALVDASPRAWR